MPLPEAGASARRLALPTPPQHRFGESSVIHFTERNVYLGSIRARHVSWEDPMLDAVIFMVLVATGGVLAAWFIRTLTEVTGPQRLFHGAAHPMRRGSVALRAAPRIK